jgi:hypothetical protein
VPAAEIEKVVLQRIREIARSKIILSKLGEKSGSSVGRLHEPDSQFRP